MGNSPSSPDYDNYETTNNFSEEGDSSAELSSFESGWSFKTCD